MINTQAEMRWLGYTCVHWANAQSGRIGNGSTDLYTVDHVDDTKHVKWGYFATRSTPHWLVCCWCLQPLMVEWTVSTLHSPNDGSSMAERYGLPLWCLWWWQPAVVVVLGGRCTLTLVANVNFLIFLWTMITKFKLLDQRFETARSGGKQTTEGLAQLRARKIVRMGGA